ncbi:hypothetical protein HMPREF0993_03171 [Lachnospiraceae bacterium 5_1_57FAA]|nr:hypothetical protein HMPREF0993_03171 [Lachnospiraceae bacterium 5_1_57FAA]
MANSIFMNIYLQKLREFVNIFSNDSESIFKAHGNTLIHPGEFGKYREETTKNILKMLLKKSYGIGDGFILTSKDTVSTQCDIVIYDNNTIPLIQENSVNFFPVETVVGIGEIKSSLNKTQFKETLQKMAKNKALQFERIKQKRQQESDCFNEFDSICSFLICDDINFNLQSIDFDEIYQGFDIALRHNCILIINKGCFFYKLTKDRIKGSFFERQSEKELTYPFPVHIEKGAIYPIKSAILLNETSREELAGFFFHHLTLGIEKCIIHSFHLSSYSEYNFEEYYLQDN